MDSLICHITSKIFCIWQKWKSGITAEKNLNLNLCGLEITVSRKWWRKRGMMREVLKLGLWRNWSLAVTFLWSGTRKLLQCPEEGESFKGVDDAKELLQIKWDRSSWKRTVRAIRWMVSQGRVIMEAKVEVGLAKRRWQEHNILLNKCNKEKRQKNSLIS